MTLFLQVAGRATVAIILVVVTYFIRNKRKGIEASNNGNDAPLPAEVIIIQIPILCILF